MRVSIILIGLGLMLGLPTSGRAVDPDTKCYADKVKGVQVSRIAGVCFPSPGHSCHCSSEMGRVWMERSP